MLRYIYPNCIGTKIQLDIQACPNYINNLTEPLGA